MIKVGITGQAGFIGTHLFNTFGLYPDKYERIFFDDSYFTNNKKLLEFVSKCDVIVHLAGMNRHNDPDIIYKTNIDLVKSLVDACETSSVKPHILFSSSTQEEKDNLYGKSKKEGRELFENWATKNNARFTGFVIPNVFGPFGNPYYNSVVATFCHQLTHSETPIINNDSEIKLIYVGDLVSEILKNIELKAGDRTIEKEIEKITVPHSFTIGVSELRSKLAGFKDKYFESGILPDLDDNFNLKLYNTFLTYIEHKSFFPFYLNLRSDDRGSFVEAMKLNSGGQVSFSTTKPGVTRGNHFHTRKAERFIVIKGKAIIKLRKIGTNKVLSFELDGDKPSFVDMPVWFSHNITNAGNDDLFTIFWINEHYNTSDPDTFYELV